MYYTIFSPFLQIDNLQLHYDNKTRTTSNSPGVDIQIPGWGNSTVVEWIDPSSASSGAYFSHLAAALLPLGYDRGASLRGAPYDFRKAPSMPSIRQSDKLIILTEQISVQSTSCYDKHVGFYIRMH